MGVLTLRFSATTRPPCATRPVVHGVVEVPAAVFCFDDARRICVSELGARLCGRRAGGSFAWPGSPRRSQEPAFGGRGFGRHELSCGIRPS